MWMSTNATKGVFIYQFRLNYSGERALQSLLKGLTPSSYNAWMPRVESIVLSSVRASITPVRKVFVPADGFPTLPCIDKKHSSRRSTKAGASASETSVPPRLARPAAMGGVCLVRIKRKTKKHRREKKEEVHFSKLYTHAPKMK